MCDLEGHVGAGLGAPPWLCGLFSAWSTPLPTWTTIPVSFPLLTDIWVVSVVASSGEAAVRVGAHVSGGHTRPQGLWVAADVCLQLQWASQSASRSGSRCHILTSGLHASTPLAVRCSPAGTQPGHLAFGGPQPYKQSQRHPAASWLPLPSADSHGTCTPTCQGPRIPAFCQVLAQEVFSVLFTLSVLLSRFLN